MAPPVFLLLSVPKVLVLLKHRKCDVNPVSHLWQNYRHSARHMSEFTCLLVWPYVLGMFSSIIKSLTTDVPGMGGRLETYSVFLYELGKLVFKISQ